MTEPEDRICVANCGLPGDECACYRQMVRPAAVTVKPLEWEYHEPPSVWCAISIVGEYEVDTQGSWTLTVNEAIGAVRDGGKAAAQADYERRILSQVNVTPAPVTVKPLEWVEGDNGRWSTPDGHYQIQYFSEPMKNIDTGKPTRFCLMRPGKDNLFYGYLEEAQHSAQCLHGVYIMKQVSCEVIEPIPSGVRWNAHTANFYDVSTHKGMGHEFYEKWRGRVDEFPTKPASKKISQLTTKSGTDVTPAPVTAIDAQGIERMKVLVNGLGAYAGGMDLARISELKAILNNPIPTPAPGAQPAAAQPDAVQEAEFDDLSDKQLKRERDRLDDLAREATNSAARVKTEMMRRALKGGE